MTAFRAPILILGYITTLFGLETLTEAPRAESEPITAAPSTWVTEYPYGEVPLAALAATTVPATTTSTTTTVWVEPQPKSECEQALQIALNVGWPAKELARLAVVMWRESRCTPGPVLNPDDPYGGSYGLTQINGYWCKPNGFLQSKGIIKQCVELYGTETNLRAALAIWRNSGWHPWGM